MRVAGDSLVARYGATLVLRTGSVLASLALLVVVTAPTWPVAVLGFTLLGAGVSVIAPLGFWPRPGSRAATGRAWMQ